MQTRPRLARGVAALVAVGILAGGAAYTATAMRAAKVTKIAIATPAKDNDYGWNQQGVKAARAAAKAYKAKIQVVTNIGYDKTDVVLRQLATSGATFSIAHPSASAPAAPRPARRSRVRSLTYSLPS